MRDSRTTRLLVVGTLLTASVGMVAMTGWRLWPEWLKHRERSDIEKRVKTLTLRNYDREAESVFNKGDRDTTCTLYGIEFSRHVQRFDWYCVVAPSVPVPGSSDANTVRGLRVYRLENPPERYEPKTDGGRLVLDLFYVKGPNDPIKQWAFFGDFIWMISGKTQEDVGISYKLIHADPPQDVEN